MEQVSLGRTDAAVSVVGLGTSAYSGGLEPLRRGIELGATLIDTAEIYGTEEIVGAAIRGLRPQVFLATKVWPTHLKPRDVRRAAEGSLSQLGTDYIDLYQVHWPNPRVPIEETIGAMEDLVDAGMVRHLGVSNFTVRELERASAAARRHRIVSNQVSFSLTDRRARRELLPYCRERGISLIAYSPLGRGLDRIRARDREGALDSIAAELVRTPAQVALNWCISQGCVAIPKSSSRARVEENCGAAGWRLGEEHRARLEASIREGRPPYRRRGPIEASMRAAVRILLERTGVRRNR